MLRIVLWRNNRMANGPVFFDWGLGSLFIFAHCQSPIFNDLGYFNESIFLLGFFMPRFSIRLYSFSIFKFKLFYGSALRGCFSSGAWDWVIVEETGYFTRFGNFNSRRLFSKRNFCQKFRYWVRDLLSIEYLNF